MSAATQVTLLEALRVTRDSLDAAMRVGSHLMNGRDYERARIAEAQADEALAAIASAEAQQVGVAAEPVQSFGIIDPDYARVFTQARILAWQYGFACLAHGSFTRDLDLLLVPWTDTAKAEDVDYFAPRIADAAGLKVSGHEPSIRPHGRKTWTLLFPGFADPRWVDLSVLVPAASPPPAAPAPQAQHKAEPVASERAAEMLAAYVEAIKASGDYERWHYIPEVEAVAEALRAHPAPTQPVPQGWKLVPVEPTSNMLAAMSGEWHSSRWAAARIQYAAMLAAAPQPEQPAPGETTGSAS